jgi:hypothetical protein
MTDGKWKVASKWVGNGIAFSANEVQDKVCNQGEVCVKFDETFRVALSKTGASCICVFVSGIKLYPRLGVVSRHYYVVRFRTGLCRVVTTNTAMRTALQVHPGCPVLMNVHERNSLKISTNSLCCVWGTASARRI